MTQHAPPEVHRAAFRFGDISNKYIFLRDELGYNRFLCNESDPEEVGWKTDPEINNGEDTVKLKVTAALAAAISTVLLTLPAEARHHRYHRVVYSTDQGQILGGRPSGCPHAFCGCGTSIHVFGRIIPELNLASNWLRFPRAYPAPGMVAVRNHHVFAIESVNGDGTVVAYDPNSGGHATRLHTVSLSGYSVRDPRGASIGRSREVRVASAVPTDYMARAGAGQ